jgi:diguanylate cyclase (GGDEF)-like protein
MTRRRTPRRPQPRDRGALLAYTTITTLAGFASLVWAAATFPIDEAISLTAAGGREGILLGLIFWIAIGVLGGTRVERMHGHGVLTFHLPFIIAAMAVGGPTAGALVALLSTIERRELREVPWYGTVANHAHLTLSAVVGGVVLLGIERWLGVLLPDKPQAVELIAIIGGGGLMTLIAISLAAGTVHLRDGLTRGELLRLYDTAYRATAATEVVLGWILAYTYTALGWWAALVAAILVLAVWQSHDATTISHHDPMTGLLNRSGFDVRLAHAIDASQRHDRLGALLAIDLDGFKAINDRNGHPVGDEVLRVVGERLQASIRLTDAAVRLGGDEFGVLLVDLPNAGTAKRLAKRIHDTIARPMDVDGRPLQVGASIGVYLIERTRKPPTTGLVHELADKLMYEAKVAGGGIRFSDRAGDAMIAATEELATVV